MKVFLGLFWLAVLFAACFLSVYILLWVSRREGLWHRRKPPPASTAEEKPPEPIYYIVEKKSRRKNTYSKPKRINFE